VRICKAASINGHEFIVFALKVLPEVRQIMAHYLCLCEKPNMSPTAGVVYHCKFQGWLVECNIYI
jgi:hypothetical protein